MQLDGGVARPGEAACAEADGGEAEVPAVFLDEQVGGRLGHAEEAVQRAVDGARLVDPLVERGFRVVPASLELDERDAIRRVPVHLVRRQKDERRLGGVPARGLEQVERADRVHVEVVEGPAGGEVVRRLGGGVDDEVGLVSSDERVHAVAVPQVEVVVREALRLRPQAREVRCGIAEVTEEVAAHVVVDAVDVPAALVEEGDQLTADEAARPGDERRGHAGRL